MARLAASVVVISARAGMGFRGLTATSLVSISAEPPMVLVGLERVTLTRNAVVESKAFNVSVLTRSQEFVAERFAGRAPAVAASGNDVPHHLGTNGHPLVERHPFGHALAGAERRRPFVKTHQTLRRALLDDEDGVLEIWLELIRDRIHGFLRRGFELRHAHLHI